MENSIEELKQRLEELYQTQQARLDVGADDLDIREEIAEAEDEIKELQADINEKNNNGIDTNVGSIGNSIEEDITKINTYVELVLKKDYCNCNELNTILGKHCDGSKNVAYAMQHILSAYKRVLKENEILKEEKEQAWEEWNNLEQGSYVTEQKLKQQIKELRKENERYKKSDYETICLENNELREITDRIQSEYNDLLKENFRLKNQLENKRKEYQETYKDVREELKELKKENEEFKNKLSLKQFDVNIVYNDYLEKLNEYERNTIQIQRIKDKIKEIDKKIKYEENEKVVIYLHKQKNILQELLESEE